MKRSNTVLSIALVLGALGLSACGAEASASDAAKPISTPPVASAPTSTATPETAAPTTVATTDAPTTTAAATTTEPEVVAPVSVVDVVDGDTVVLSTGERLRVIGIDAPEQGQCGYDEATFTLAGLVLDRQVVVTPGARDDVDKYGRILRYIDVDGVDAGREIIAAGYAVARYDSRDGYGRHTREDDYVELDAATQDHTCAPATTAPRPAPAPAPAPTVAPAPAPTVAPAPAPSGCDPNYTGCVPTASDVDCAGGSGNGPAYTGPVRVIGTDIYDLDRDGDGYACE